MERSRLDSSLDPVTSIAFAALPEACLIMDAHQTISAANDAFTAATGYPEHELLGKDWRLLAGPGTDPITVGRIGAALADGNAITCEVLTYRKDGSAFWNHLSIAPLEDARGGASGSVSVHRDVTERIHAQAGTSRLLAEAATQQATLGALLDITRALAGHTSMRTVLSAIPSAILSLCGADSAYIALWDDATSRLSMVEVAGWDGPMQDRVLAYTLSPNDSPELADIVALREPVLVTTSSSSDWGKALLNEFALDAFAVVPMETEDALTGLLIANWARTSTPPDLAPDLDTRLAGLAGIAAAAIQNARLIDQVRWSASHDPLTGLANRDLLERTISAALDRLPEGAGLAVVFCDVDGFNRINDSYGHATGDRVLQEIASRLRSALRVGDLAARVGGDEFVLLLSGVDAATEVSPVLDRLHEALAVPIETGGASLRVHLSTGSAHQRQGRPPQNARALVLAADADRYRRKADGGSRRLGVPATERPDLAPDLARAVRLGQILTYYQPQLDVASGRIVAVEALARWAHPRLGLLEPHRFIPLAETSGMILEIGRHVLETACRAAVEARRHDPGLTMSVNVSRRELGSPDYAQQLEGVLADSGLPPDALTLEITESHLVSDPALLEEQAHLLSASGVRLSLDDFGTGYTAFAQLQTLPLSELKIDRTFTQDIRRGRVDLVAGIIALAHELHLTVVAEGVETEAQLVHLRTVGCDRAQGYAIAGPLPLDDLGALDLRGGRA
jgi:diguanylate cyclase (GGDEF)-like protein/PAS domain S-box-containing protein